MSIKENIRQGTLPEKPISVSEYISVLNEILVRIRVKLVGEVSGMKIASSGHVYFSLKDEKTGDVINCALWNSVYRMCGVKLEEGMQVIISGSADIYGVRGSLTFKVKTIEPVGEGALRKAYEELKAKLTKEGLFDPERKRTLPAYPRKIGVITSKKGAAIHDFVNNLGKFGCKVYLCDSRVEGQEAVKDLLLSLKVMKEKDLDVLAILRGGGSLESLIAFDNEMLVREIKNFPVPVVAGIGHHEDITLVALAADVSESTPTAAANKLSKGFQEAKEIVFSSEREIIGSYKENIHQKKEVLYEQTESVKGFFREIIERYKGSEEEIKRVVSFASYLIREKERRMMNSFKEIIQELKNSLRYYTTRIENLENSILLNNPERQLKKGYAIMQKEGKVVKSINDLREEEVVETIHFDGRAESQIKKIKKNKKYE